jgi:hypothetical protein
LTLQFTEHAAPVTHDIALFLGMQSLTLQVTEHAAADTHDTALLCRRAKVDLAGQCSPCAYMHGTLTGDAYNILKIIREWHLDMG